MKTLAEELYATHPDTIVILSGHSAQHENAFSINLHDEYWADLKEFGDMETAKEFAPDLGLIDRIQRTLRKEDIPLTLDSDSTLDHGAGVSLLLLTEELSSPTIVPISYSGLSPKEHVHFGRALKDVLTNSPKRIAVIASGDLSHCLSEDAPDGYREEGQQFDDLIRSAVEHVGTSKLLSLDPELVRTASECGYHPLLMLFGIIERMDTSPAILSYESPFGVGYLVAHFQFA
jgi:AmmeMemoRadiSam system protein B